MAVRQTGADTVSWKGADLRTPSIPRMPDTGSHTTALQGWLDALRAGSEPARAELISRSCQRLRELAHRMLKNYPRLRRWEQTDDVLQNAMIRLHRSLAEVKPESVAEFLGLAALQVRRTLVDLVRHHFGPEGMAAHHHTDGLGAARDGAPSPRICATASVEPEDLEAWTRFHETVESLPGDPRQTFHLLWYEGLTQAEAAAVLGVNERTVRRRWLAARCAIFEALGGEGPQ